MEKESVCLSGKVMHSIKERDKEREGGSDEVIEQPFQPKMEEVRGNEGGGGRKGAVVAESTTNKCVVGTV